jgi:hypothetical protein
METSMKENSKQTTSRVMGDISGSMEENTKASGKIIRCMERVLSSGQMEENMKDSM